MGNKSQAQVTEDNVCFGLKNRFQRAEISHEHLKPTPCFPLTFVRSPTGDQRMPSCDIAQGLKANQRL